jgi:hypothetical protein
MRILCGGGGVISTNYVQDCGYEIAGAQATQYTYCRGNISLFEPGMAVIVHIFSEPRVLFRSCAI